jgi:diketogulonate reductase-like aldo/keto reductase
MNIPTLPLKLQGEIPIMGFGTYPMKGDECQRAVEAALELGYRHLDTADNYGNQEPVGAAIKASGIARGELFVTTKVPRERLRFDDVIRTCENSLRELRTDYLDLYLVHWPNNDIPMEETFRAMARLLDDGRIRAFGVSNFTASRLERALALEIAPIAMNQVEYHPLLNQTDLHQFCEANGVAITAYSPLAQGKIADEPAVREVARRVGRAPGQVTLRWLYQRGIVAIPKASSREHIRENLEVLDFELPPEEFRAMDTIDRWVRLINWDVAEFDK